MDLNNLQINTLGGIPVVSSSSAVVNKSVLTDGTNGFISVDAVTGFPLYTTNPSFTISMFMKIPTAAATDKALWSETSHLSIGPMYFVSTGDTDKTKIRFFLRTNTSTVVKGPVQATAQTWNLDTWFHLCWVDDNGTVAVYVDNTLKTSGEFNYTRNTDMSFTRATLGAMRRTTNGNFLNAYYDRFKVFTRALGTAEIGTLAAGGDVTTGKIVDYNMNDNLTDQSGNGNNGTLSASGASYSTDVPA